jgi:tetratricopeptide (TPR) repeat protein
MLQARVELAQALLRENAGRTALDLLDKAPEEQKRTLGFLVERNWALMALKEFVAARRAVDEGLKRARASALLLQDGLLRLQANDNAGARRSLEEVLKQNPEDVRALDALALSFATQKQPGVAVQKVKEHASQHPKSAALQMALGRWLVRTGNRAEARKAFQAAEAAAPNWPIPMLALAELDIGENKLAEARQTLAKHAASEAGNPHAQMLLAMAEHKAGNLEAAIQQYRKVVELDPRNLAAMNNLAYLLADVGNQPDEALKYAQQVKELAPKSVFVDDTIGWAYFRKGIYSTAITYLEAAVKQDGTAIRRYHLAMAYMKAARVREGETMLESALAIDPNLPEARAAKQLLAEVGQDKGQL